VGLAAIATLQWQAISFIPFDLRRLAVCSERLRTVRKVAFFGSAAMPSPDPKQPLPVLGPAASPY
jgi:hypothetical protein